MNCTNCGQETESPHIADYVLAKTTEVASVGYSQSSTTKFYTDVEPLHVAVCDRCLATAAWRVARRGLTFVGCFFAFLTVIALIAAASPKAGLALRAVLYATVFGMWAFAIGGWIHSRRQLKSGSVEAADERELAQFAEKERKARGKSEFLTLDEWLKKKAGGGKADKPGPGVRSGSTGVCDICARPIASPDGYLLTTRTVVTTPAYWKKVLPAILRNSLGASWQTHPALALSMLEVRQAAAAQVLPWMSCDECVGLFEVSRDEAREWAQLWWASGGAFAPPGNGPVPIDEVRIVS